MILQKILSVENCDPLQKIRECEVVSFDIFDTAIVRPFLHHFDMYHIVEKLIPNKRFYNVRMRAEKNTRKSLIQQKQIKEEITIDNIYEHIHIDKEKAIKTELGFDIEICRKRQYIFKLYKFAINLNKRIIFTSDITYPKKTIEQILHTNGFTHYERLYISSEENLSKQQGGIYNKIIFELNVAPHRILHIGDSIRADIHQAKKYGIKPLYIAKPLHALEHIINKSQFNIEKTTINSALFASAANMICHPAIEQKRKFVVTFPFTYKLATTIFKEKKEHPVFLIHEGQGNVMFHLFSEVYSHFSKTPIQFFEVDLAQVYASSVRTFEDLKTLQRNISKENFSHILSVYFKTQAKTIEEIERIWSEIEILALQARKEVVEKCEFLKTHTVYDFTFNSTTKDFLQNTLNSSIGSYIQVHKILEKTIEKSTKSSWFVKPKPLEIIEEMKSITNEEMQRYIFPQSQYFFGTLGKYLHILDKKTFDKIS